MILLARIGYAVNLSIIVPTTQIHLKFSHTFDTTFWKFIGSYGFYLFLVFMFEKHKIFFRSGLWSRNRVSGYKQIHK